MSIDLVDGGNPSRDRKDTRSPGPGLAPKAEPPRLKHEGNRPASPSLSNCSSLGSAGVAGLYPKETLGSNREVHG